jgi:predicted membrane-bound spermidine synthase
MPLLVLPIFCLSGLAALMYQVVWQRMLTIYSGADVHSATIVVAAFMAGLGCGSFVGGAWADRVSTRSSILLFGASELAIGAFGWFSAALYYGVLYERVSLWHLGTWSTGAILFLTLLWPTFFMGSSLPLLARGFAAHRGAIAARVGVLYGVNTAGAAAGALVATWVLIPRSGMAGTIHVAVVINAVCGLLAIPLAWRVAPHADRVGASVEVPRGPTREPSDGSGWRVWGLLFGASGFFALSYELVGFRLLNVMLKSSAFVFGTLIGAYLVGLGGGAALGSFLVRSARRPQRAFLSLQALALIYGGLAPALLIHEIDAPALRRLAAPFAAYEALDVRAALGDLGQLAAGLNTISAHPAAVDFIWLYVVLPLLLIGIPTFLSGLSFPFLQHVVQTDARRVGRRTGHLLAANIAGSTCGAFVTGWFLLDWFGTAGTLRMLVCAGVAFAAVAVCRESRASRRLAPLTFIVVTGTSAVAAIPSGSVLWSRLHGATPRAAIVGEDATGLSVLRAERPDFRRRLLFVNGIGHSWLPYGGVHTALGALPAFAHPHPRDVMIIGLGSGDSLFGLASRMDLEHVTSVEIVRPQLMILRRFASTEPYRGVHDLLDDRRIDFVWGDARRYLRQTSRRFDIIEADALYPSSAYAGNLYSDAYFRLLLDHLTPGGFAVTWVPTERTSRTLLRVFPFAWRKGDIAIGSNAPIAFDRDAVERRVSTPGVVERFALAGIDVRELLHPYLSGDAQSYDPSYDRSSLTDINTDLDPRDEFELGIHTDR